MVPRTYPESFTVIAQKLYAIENSACNTITLQR